MNKTKLGIFILSIALLVGGFGVSAATNPQVQTQSATVNSQNSATLSGYLGSSGGDSSATVWFQWGTSTSYENETPHQAVSFSGNFTQTVSNLTSNTNYHFRAVAQNSSGTSYGQDMQFISGQSITNYGTGSAIVNLQVINLSSGNLNWSKSTDASLSDIVAFQVAIQAGPQDLHNAVLINIFPNNLSYANGLDISGAPNNSRGDISSGINLGTIPAGQTVTVRFQAQVSGNSSDVVNFTSNETGAISDTASVNVISLVNPGLEGPTSIPTGVKNNFLTDSFFLPLFLLLSGSWFYFSGRVYKFSDWLVKKI